jgi:ABC-type dipeptide/oligopeptide/nickel transport system permease subunit
MIDVVLFALGIVFVAVIAFSALAYLGLGMYPPRNRT